MYLLLPCGIVSQFCSCYGDWRTQLASCMIPGLNIVTRNYLALWTEIQTFGFILSYPAGFLADNKLALKSKGSNRDWNLDYFAKASANVEIFYGLFVKQPSFMHCQKETSYMGS